MSEARARWGVVATVMLGTLSVIIETTIINVAVPHLRVEFGLAQTQVQWVVGGFFAAMTVTMLVSAWAIERFGLRPTYIACLLFFVLASLLGGLAPNFVCVVLARVAQGAAAGIVQPLALVALFRVFPPERRGFAMGVYGLGVILAPAMGPTAGGLLVDAFSWRAVFLVAPPFCLIGVLVARAFLNIETRSERPRPFDLRSLLMLSVALPSILWGLSSIRRLGADDPGVLFTLVGGAALAALFVRRQLRHPSPMIDLRIHRAPGFAAASALAFVMGAGLFGITYLLPLFIQDVQGLSATESGLILMPAGLAMALIFPVAGTLADRVRVEGPILAGLAALSGSMVALAGLDAATPFLVVAGWTLVGRVGVGLMMPPINAGGLKLLPAELVAQGSGAIGFARQLGGAFGVNLIALLLETRAAHHVDAARPGSAIRDAHALAFHDVFLTVAVVVAAAAAPAILMGRAAARLKTTAPELPASG